MLLARVSRKLGALSPAERSMLRAAWDHASTMAAQFAATNQLTSRRADRADAWMMVEHEYDQLLDRLDDVRARRPPNLRRALSKRAPDSVRSR
jgi:hypothetical protein